MRFHKHLINQLKKHKTGVFLYIILALILLIIAIPESRLMKTSIYLLVMTGAFLISEFIYYKNNPSINKWEIKKPKKNYG
ncbi:hypothetical protein DCC35_15910 [Mangrovivirga cuniculi]|uniref:Uncharacterized protein n=1 Tax=Mangrovivirga cuniculi TaxID=2715131 RepID=A0A4D7JJH1_9BACT|nr:hypothetical protein DCC35_15910 [Mangrovivirga cuniculi]